jgi:hypothetical protein
MAEDAVALSRALINEARPKVDKDGRDFIKASLGAADTNPWQTITSLQTALSPGLSLFAAPLAFLHMMESSNASVGSNVLESLKVQVENAVGKMDEAALHTMLPATIQLIHFKELRSIPIAVMKSMTTIPESCLRTLVAQDSISVTLSSCSHIHACNLTTAINNYAGVPACSQAPGLEDGRGILHQIH